jgi:hypothetical protein
VWFLITGERRTLWVGRGAGACEKQRGSAAWEGSRIRRMFSLIRAQVVLSEGVLRVYSPIRAVPPNESSVIDRLIRMVSGLDPALMTTRPPVCAAAAPSASVL